MPTFENQKEESPTMDRSGKYFYNVDLTNRIIAVIRRLRKKDGRPQTKVKSKVKSKVKTKVKPRS